MMTGGGMDAGPSTGEFGDRAVKTATTRSKSEGGTLGNGDLEMEVRDGKKYAEALKTFLPYRNDSTKRSGILPSSHAGLYSFLTMSWMTPLMWKAFKQGLVVSDLWELDDVDKAEKNAKRLKRIWEDEKVLVGLERASLAKAVWKFGKTRFYICIFLMILSVILQFLGPAWILKLVLNYQEDLSLPLEFGLTLVVFAFVAQLLRNLTYSGIWAIGIHTGLRIEGALQYMAYEKMLKLRNGGEAVLSQCITFCTNEQERIFECVFSGVLAIAAPVMFIMCLIYTTTVLGWWALLGNAVIFFFYPLMGIIAKFIGDFRRKAVKHTQRRVGLMNEILNSIRLIKMYGWEDSFSTKIKGIRAAEEKQQQKAAFCQSLTSTITPMVNTVASIAVFLGFTLAGNNLTSSEAFTIFSVFAAMQFTVGTLPFAMRAIAEAVNCLSRFKKFLELPEFEVDTEYDLDCDHDAVVVIQKGCFAWEIETQEGSSEKSGQTQQSKNGPKEKRKKSKQKSEENGKSKSPTPEEENLTNANTKGDFVKLEDCLRGIDLEIKRGSLTGVCGLVGSGKSSLLSAILGDMVKSSGKLLIRGSLAIVSQQAWIYSDSFQENILFGSPMNKEKYEKVLDICCLRPDIETLPNGDMTLIGERGVNLSGGQKQRVNLARAIYADKSIYLLDDPLAAVDSIIAKTIFEGCIKEHLKDKTVILVTNAVQLLQDCESIIFIKDGEIAEQGRHSYLVDKRGHYFNLLQYHNRNEAGEIDTDTSIVEVEVRQRRASTSPKKRASKTVEIETVAKKLTEDDSVYSFAGFKSYVLYLQACGGYIFSFLAFVLLLGFSLTRIFSVVWIQRWIDAGDGKMNERLLNNTNETYTDQQFKGYVTDNEDLGMYQLVLAISVLVILVVGLLKGAVTTRLVLFGASRLHERMFLKVINSPMMFFDTTPLGKITNRFSKDMDELDARLPFFVEFVSQAVIFVLSSLIVVCVVFPTFTIALILILGIMIFMDVWLNFCVRETRKLENVMKTPVIHHLQSSLGGLSIIRTFRREDAFRIRFAKYVNNHLIAATVYRAANRWFTFRLDTVSLGTIFVSMLLAVLFRGSVSPALVGLALSNIYTVCSFLPFVMRMKSELQSRFISVERILEYSEELESEESASATSRARPEEGWPKAGGIKFESVCMKYQDKLDYVINEISFEVQPSEKIGIVGRTGAGKTSIIAALLRLYPIDKGDVTIDNVNTSQISLKNLRRSIAVIPQDPVLFQGTLRYNLDPFEDYSDEDVWSALEKSHIKSKIEKEEKKLNTPVSTDGENFSVGEKQLICLARALLRKNKILLLDEATANLDIETDYLIQNTIQEAFKECTVITVAHRLNTIANYDRIIVMQRGKIVEMDTPKKLMETEGSVFHKMMLAAGISNLDQLKQQQEPTHTDRSVISNRESLE